MADFHCFQVYEIFLLKALIVNSSITVSTNHEQEQNCLKSFWKTFGPLYWISAWVTKQSGKYNSSNLWCCAKQSWNGWEAATNLFHHLQNHKGAIYPINVTHKIKQNGFISNPKINFKLAAYQFCSAQASSNSSALFMRERDSALVSWSLMTSSMRSVKHVLSRNTKERMIHQSWHFASTNICSKNLRNMKSQQYYYCRH